MLDALERALRRPTSQPGQAFDFTEYMQVDPYEEPFVGNPYFDDEEEMVMPELPEPEESESDDEEEEEEEEEEDAHSGDEIVGSSTSYRSF